MAWKQLSPGQIIGMLRGAEVKLSQEEELKWICRGLWAHGAGLLPLAEGLR